MLVVLCHRGDLDEAMMFWGKSCQVTLKTLTCIKYTDIHTDINMPVYLSQSQNISISCLPTSLHQLLTIALKLVCLNFSFQCKLLVWHIVEIPFPFPVFVFSTNIYNGIIQSHNLAQLSTVSPSYLRDFIYHPVTICFGVIFSLHFIFS